MEPIIDIDGVTFPFTPMPRKDGRPIEPRNPDRVAARRHRASIFCQKYQNGIADCATCRTYDAADFLPEENHYEPACPAHPIYY